MKKILSVLLAMVLLCSMLPVGALAAYDATKPACQVPGHEKFDGANHNRPQSCWVKGHFNCDGMNHERAACGKWGHFNCDGKEHSPTACGVSDQNAKEPAAADQSTAADQSAADEQAQQPAACGVEGHYAHHGRGHQRKPMSKYCNATPQHMVCQGDQQHFCDPAQGGCGDTYLCSNSNAHTTCRMCGLLWCDYALGGHETPCKNANHRPCVYRLNGEKYVKSEHEYCYWCGEAKCNGEEHGDHICVKTCKACGQSKRHNKSHRMECGHYGCVPSRERHEICPVEGCGKWICDEHSHRMQDKHHKPHGRHDRDEHRGGHRH